MSFLDLIEGELNDDSFNDFIKEVCLYDKSLIYKFRYGDFLELNHHVEIFQDDNGKITVEYSRKKLRDLLDLYPVFRAGSVEGIKRKIIKFFSD